MVTETKARSSGAITLKEWESRKSFVGFTDDDVALLREVRPTADGCVEEIVKEIYARFMKYDEARALFHNETILNNSKEALRRSFRGLTGGEYGEGYLLDRIEFGRGHQRLGMSLRWSMAEYSIYLQMLLPRIHRALEKDSAKAMRALLAVIKIVSLDKELTSTAYFLAAEEVISRQAREILELSTPVIQIWEGIIVAPLIGTLDSERTQQFMERLLEKVVETNSPVALIDITGVPAIDTQTARHLVECITAVRLLGAQAILTGVRPSIAQTLVHLGIDLPQVTTRPSLRSGLQMGLDVLGFQLQRANSHQLAATAAAAP